MESCRVAFEWRSRCQFTLPKPSVSATGLSWRESNVRRSSTVPLPLGKTKVAGSNGGFGPLGLKNRKRKRPQWNQTNTVPVFRLVEP